jgi:hypothetical protein
MMTTIFGVSAEAATFVEATRDSSMRDKMRGNVIADPFRKTELE